MINGSRINLGADVGEANTPDGVCVEHALMAYVTAVSIACGGHAGDAQSIRETLASALDNGCLIGAHPSYPDRVGFGRRSIEIPRATLKSSLESQLEMIAKIADDLGSEIQFIKAHGALYHDVAHNAEFTLWYLDVCSSILPNVSYAFPIGSAGAQVLNTAIVILEGFCDRTYESDGTLRDRSREGALITDPHLASQQTERLICEEGCRMLCVHSDTPGAIEIAKRVRDQIDADFS
jgi:UPF0271 protein